MTDKLLSVQAINGLRQKSFQSLSLDSLIGNGVKGMAGKKKAAEKTKKTLVELPPLNNKEEKFCVEYAASDNQVKSFMFVWPNYSYKAASVEARRLLENPLIIERIAELKEERRKALEPTIDKVLAELCKLAFYDPRAFFDEDMKLRPLSELHPDHAAVIAGIETIHKVTGEEGDGVCITTKIKLPDKNTALEKLGKNLLMWKDVGSKDNPQEIIPNGTFSDTERSARLLFLLEQAEKRAKK